MCSKLKIVDNLIYLSCVLLIDGALGAEIWGSPQGVEAKVLDCDLKVSKIELQTFYYIHFWTNSLGKGMNSFIPPPMG